MANIQGSTLAEPTLEIDLVERARRTAEQIDKRERGGQDQKFVDNMIAFGRYIKRLRKEQDITRQDLSHKANVDPESLFMLEQGLLTVAELTPLLSQIASSLQKGVEDLQWELTSTLRFDS